METAAQIRRFLTPSKRSSKCTPRKPCRTFHTNHSRHKLKDRVMGVLQSNLYYRVGVVLFIVVSAISVEMVSASQADTYGADSVLSRQPRSSRNSVTRTISNREPSAYDNTSAAYVADDRRIGAGPMCSLCDSREERINYTLNALKAEILEKLGLKHPPNTTGLKVPKIPPLNMILDAHRGNAHMQTPGMIGDQPFNFRNSPYNYDEDDNYWVKTEKIIFLPEQLKLRHTFRDNVLQFKFSEKTMKNDIEKATLFFFLRGLEDFEEEHAVMISLFTVTKNGGVGDNLSLVSSHPEFKKSRKSLEGEWLSMDVTGLVSQWFKSPRSNHGIIIRAAPAEPMDPAPSKPLINTDISDEHYFQMPYLEVYTKEKEKHRKKRDLGMTCDEKSNDPKCCRYPLTVDFDSFGWAFVIAPKRYEAYYCSGECPFVYLPTYPHTHVRQMAQPKQSPSSAQHHGPCCAAKKMSPLSMLYFDDSQSIIFGTLPHMVVDRCGCQ
ncbi:unnamed protein product [Bemisia tabaci]|uniref:TGF-beta family profile domain-containing protein n=1 Tax=Bemisia tabaci TaxID=7038 RepID=A0A9P0F4X4_BEMTA|nr:unnamed protein product [Bemisia tabaci]